uniref:Uncharacterized protein n=2 Tax=Picea TaxID=3328 RepID=A0A117NGN9_PICGL|nr:hypothetical protein ABT39_MTgene6053 [Picea glauca]QHR91438.1 hypothetical protein Q903MT_gene5472 [Picea sitchensis]
MRSEEDSTCYFDKYFLGRWVHLRTRMHAFYLWNLSYPYLSILVSRRSALWMKEEFTWLWSHAFENNTQRLYT